ncbi:MAG: hypothetical protein U1F25_03320 [Rubrivivax sp.]
MRETTMPLASASGLPSAISTGLPSTATIGFGARQIATAERPMRVATPWFTDALGQVVPPLTWRAWTTKAPLPPSSFFASTKSPVDWKS